VLPNQEKILQQHIKTSKNQDRAQMSVQQRNTLEAAHGNQGRLGNCWSGGVALLTDEKGVSRSCGVSQSDAKIIPTIFYAEVDLPYKLHIYCSKKMPK